MEKKNLFTGCDTLYITSWRVIPSEVELRSMEKDTTSSVLVYAEPKESGIAYDTETHELIEVDGKQSSGAVAYAAALGFVRMKQSVFATLEKGYPFVHPTSLLQLLHHLNQITPHSVSLLLRPEHESTRTVIFKPSDSQLAVCVEGQSPSSSLSITCPTGSVLRYHYVKCDHHPHLIRRLDASNSLVAWESRAFPREVRVTEGTAPLVLHDTLTAPLLHHALLDSVVRVMVSCEHWRWNQDVSFVSASVEGEDARVVRVTKNCVVCDFKEGEIGDITAETGKDRIVFSKQEIESVLNELSIEHGDGSVRKTLRDGESNFHLTVITPCSTHHDASIGVYEPA